MADIDNILQKTAEYIELTQSVIDRQNEKRNTFLKRAGEASEKLVEHGLIRKDQRETLINKLAADESEVWGLVEKLASSVLVDGLGKASSIEVADHSNLDAFERLALYGDCRARSSNSGLIE